MDNHTAILDSLHHEHHSRLIIIARSILRTSLVCDSAEADDVVQRTWIEAWQRIANGQPIDEGWLRMNATNRAKNWRRDRQRKAKYEEFSLDEPAFDEDGESVSRLDTFIPPCQRMTAPPDAEPDPRTPALHAALGRLSPLLRETVTAHYLDGRSLADIALTTGTPLGTVKRRLHDARTLLRSIMTTQPAAMTA